MPLFTAILTAFATTAAPVAKPAAGQTLDQLSKASIELAEAASNYGALKVIFGCFVAIFLLTYMQQLYQQWELRRRVKIIEEASERTMEYFSDLNNRTVGAQQAKLMVGEVLRKNEAIVKYNILKMRFENHLDDRQSADAKIRAIVEGLFTAQRAFLGNFFIRDKSISFTAVIEDNSALEQMISSWVYKDEKDFTVSNMAQMVGMYYEGIRMKAYNKIDGIED